MPLRAELDDLLEREPQGPGCGPDEEIVDGGVQDAYLVDMLAPRNRRLKGVDCLEVRRKHGILIHIAADVYRKSRLSMRVGPDSRLAGPDGTS